MEITDIVLESHIVTQGKFTNEQLKKIDQLLTDPTNVTLDQITKVLEKDGHKIIKKHAHTLEVSEFNTFKRNEENEEFLSELGNLVSKFTNQPTQQPNEQKI